jgi:hypothetical protein
MRPLLKGYAMIIKTQPTVLDETIDDALAQLKGIEVGTDEYTKKMDQITKLYALKEKNSPKRVSPDTMVLVAGNLAGIAMILFHEQAHVVTSKALSFVLKSR